MLKSGVSHPRPRFNSLRALKYRDFRLYWFGLIFSVTGYMMVVSFSLNWLIYDITGKPLYLGFVGVASAGPAILLNFFGGALADRINLKHLLGLCQSTSAVVIITLTMLYLRDVLEPWHVLLASFAIGAVQAFDSPARQSVLPRLVPREDIPSAVALHSFAWQGMSMLAPTVAGLLVARAGIEYALFFGASGFIAMASIAQVIKIRTVERVQRNVVREIADGIGYIKSNRVFAVLIGMAFCNGLFGFSSTFHLMAVFAEDVLDVGSEGMGFLLAALGAGAVTGTIVVGALGDSQAKGRVIGLGAVWFGTCLILFALSPWYASSLALLYLAGVGASLCMVTIMSTLHLLVPDQLRGRVMGIYTITFAMPALGVLPIGAIADFANPRLAVALGGAVIISFALGMVLRDPLVRNVGVPTSAAVPAPGD